MLKQTVKVIMNDFEEKINDFLVEKQNEGVPIEIIPTNNYVLIRYGYEVIK